MFAQRGLQSGRLVQFQPGAGAMRRSSSSAGQVSRNGLSPTLPGQSSELIEGPSLAGQVGQTVGESVADSGGSDSFQHHFTEAVGQSPDFGRQGSSISPTVRLPLPSGPIR
ncbi:MAG: hypothetical protein Q4C67_08510 [Deinococcus sp.]|nr:hypothetical protein [Deinococcus sp.]